MVRTRIHGKARHRIMNGISCYDKGSTKIIQTERSLAPCLIYLVTAKAEDPDEKEEHRFGHPPQYGDNQQVRTGFLAPAVPQGLPAWADVLASVK